MESVIIVESAIIVRLMIQSFGSVERRVKRGGGYWEG